MDCKIWYSDNLKHIMLAWWAKVRPILSDRIISAYHIPRIFRGMYISWLSMESEYSQLKFHGWRLSKIFCIFCALLHGYIRRIYATIFSEIHKAPYQIVSVSRSRQFYTSLWQVLGISTVVGQSKWPRWHHCHALLKNNNVQMHEVTHSTWPTVVVLGSQTTFFSFLFGREEKGSGERPI